jgi:hypothetical protein
MLFMGNGSSKPFSEIGQSAGVYQTDWSWSPLFADVDNDGFRDLLITNGFPRDITDMDFSDYRFDVQRYVSNERLLDSIPIVKIPNYAFKNQGSARFEDSTAAWGLKIPSFSNGAVYADLDLDGDLDYVVSNINDPAFVFENTLKKGETNFVQIELEGSQENPIVLGSKMVLYFEDQSFQFHELYTSKGYMSSLEGIAYFGFPKEKKISHLEVLWPDGKFSLIKSLEVNKRNKINYKSAREAAQNELKFPLVKEPISNLYQEVSLQYGIDYVHQENQINDFAFQRLLLRSVSKNDPKIEVGDLNNDGLEDFIIGSSKGYSPMIFLQDDYETFNKLLLFSDENDCNYEVEDIGLIDIENDGDLDLYLVSGGQYHPQKKYLKDRVLLNDGKGNFSKMEMNLDCTSNGSVVISSDYNQDGFQDLFIGARNTPLQYPLADTSFLIKNEQGELKIDDQQDASLFKDLGMVSDAQWVDMDGDGDEDLVVVGEFTPIQIFINEKGVFSKWMDSELEKHKGLWRSIAVLDHGGDGDNDLIIGNIGSNNMYNISKQTPMELFAVDVDQNGSIDPILFTYQKESDGSYQSYPFQFWKNLIQQSPYFRQKFDNFKSFSKATKDEYLSDEVFQKSLVLEVNQAKSVLIENLGSNQFDIIPLEEELQLAPINSILVESKKGTENPSVFLVGNDFGGNPFEGNQNGLTGILLEINNDDTHTIWKSQATGFEVAGHATDIKKIKLKDGGVLFLVAQNNDTIKVFKKDDG